MLELTNTQIHLEAWPYIGSWKSNDVFDGPSDKTNSLFIWLYWIVALNWKLWLSLNVLWRENSLKLTEKYSIGVLCTRFDEWNIGMSQWQIEENKIICGRITYAWLVPTKAMAKQAFFSFHFISNENIPFIYIVCFVIYVQCAYMFDCFPLNFEYKWIWYLFIS